MPRLFIAIDLGSEVERAVAAAIDEVRPLAPDARWVQPEASHLTLALIGHRPDEAPFQRALEKAAKGHRRMTLSLSGAGTFGTKKKPRVLWLGLEGDLEALARLRADVEASIVPLGYEPEQRPFAPHLTLARSRDPHGDPKLALCPPRLAPRATASVRKVTLFRSDLSPKGAKYTPLFEAPLA